jgi:CRISPR-associated endoribonuclease Cas6
MVNFLQFTLSRFIFTISPQGELHLPPFIGSAIRGGLGHSLRSVACFGDSQDCAPCQHKDSCHYHQIFEPSPPANADHLTNLASIPRPFIVAPLTRGDTRKPRDPIAFHLTLIGTVTSFLPYFILAFEELGKMGLGRDKTPFIVENVKFLPIEGSPQQIYSHNEHILHDSWKPYSIQDILERFGDNPAEHLTLRFITPTRIEHKGIYEIAPQFEDLLRALLRRISALAYFYCHLELDLDYKGLIAWAEQVGIAQDNLRWEKLVRRSSRQGRKIDISGFIGEIEYAGELAEFMPVIRLGEIIGVGKGAAFGLGRYEVGN